jgi:DNA-binding NtrC family response regulator
MSEQTKHKSDDGLNVRALCANYEFYPAFGDMRRAVDAAFEKEFCLRMMTAFDGNISVAARRMKMDRKHLYDLCAKHGINPAKYRAGSHD